MAGLVARQGYSLPSYSAGRIFRRAVAVHWVEEDVAGADLAVLQALNSRAELVRLQSSLLDAQSAANGYAATRQTAVSGGP